MKRPLLTILLALLSIFSLAFAQERHNSLAIDEVLDEDAGPYYFIAQGDSGNAYAKATALARGLGLSIDYDGSARLLTLKGYGVTTTIKATTDIATGLVKRSGVLSANGKDIESPMAIVVDGTAYVAITPVARAFGADVSWHSAIKLITVNSPTPERETSSSTMAQEQASGNGALAGTGGAGGAAGGGLSGFRVGVHDSFTRVAVDLGDVDGYDIAVNGNRMVVTFAASHAVQHRVERPDGHLREAWYASNSGKPALVIDARHPLSAQGGGFRVGLTEANTFYVDLGPGLSGPRVEQLASDWSADPPILRHVSQTAGAPAPAQAAAAAPAVPSNSRPVVIIDAGHGGKFAGARNGEYKEEVIVLNVAMQVRDLLQARGVDVIMTRETDTHLSSDYRGDLSARAAFATPERNLFVSIHANAASNPRANGIETFVFGQPLEQRLIDQAIEENGGENRELGIELTNESIRFANETSGLILRETQLNYSQSLAHAVQRNLVNATGAVDRGVKQNVYYVLKNARTPAILVELGFVSNPEEGRRLNSADYQAKLARALTDGILEFLNNGGTLARR